MSSAVNKSQKRFMPKVSSRGGPVGRAPARRLSSLRASFSVASPDPASLSSQSPADKNETLPKQAEKTPSRAELLGLVPEGTAVPAPESAVDESNLEDDSREVSSGNITGRSTADSTPAPPPVPRNRVRSSISEDTTTLHSTQFQYSSHPVTHSGPSRPPAEVQHHPQPQNHSAPQTGDSSTASAPKKPGSADAHWVIEKKPEAPPGCELIWPEDLPDLKASERRRRLGFEKELVSIMRRLYAEHEKTKIMESSTDILESEAEAMAQSAAELATYNQLKQAVGNEARVIRDRQTQTAKDKEDVKTILDVNKFTMAALCKDIPVGDRNDAYDDYELARVNRRRNTVRVFRAKMWSRNKYEPKEEERPALREAFKKYQDERKERNGKLRNEQKQKFTEIDDASAEQSVGSHPQASIEIQANGDISLVGTQFDRHKNNRAQREGSLGPKTEVDPTEQVINSYSFSTRERPDRWTKEETEKFYEAISALGTDFNLISHLFPMRSRNQIKTKFKYEEKRNPAKLQMYLVSKRRFNVDSYSEASKVTIEDVSSIEVELEKVRQEHKEQMKLEEVSRMQAKEEDQKKTTTKRGASANASKPYPKRERLE